MYNSSVVIGYEDSANEAAQAMIYSGSIQQGLSMSLRNIDASTCGIIFIDTPELGPSTIGLQSYLASMPASDQMTNDAYKEARWLLDVLQQFSSISGNLDITYVNAKRNEDSPQRLQGTVRTRLSDGYLIDGITDLIF